MKRKKDSYVYVLYDSVPDEIKINNYENINEDVLFENTNIIGVYNSLKLAKDKLSKEIESRCFYNVNDSNWFYKEREDLIKDDCITVVEMFYEDIGNYDYHYITVIRKIKIND